MANTPGWYGPGNIVGQANYPAYPQQQQMPQQIPQQSYAPAPQMMGVPNQGVVWVDGEIDARARQMPPGATQFAMWDMNQPVIYVKSLNQMGMPNPMQRLRYVAEEQRALPQGTSGESGDYATKADFEGLRNELASMKEMLMGRKNQNGTNNGRVEPMNKGGDRNG